MRRHSLLRARDVGTVGLDEVRNGEDTCENKGYNRHDCQAIGCCDFDDGFCWSAVGDGPCRDGASKDPDGPSGDCSEEAPEIKASPLPDELNAYRKYFEKYVSIFGIPIIAEKGVSDWKLEHAGHVMAQYLDYDGDGKVNNEEVLKKVHATRGLILMFEDPESEAMEKVWDADLGGQDLNEPDIPRHVRRQHKRHRGSSANHTRSAVRTHKARALFANLSPCLKSEIRRHTGSPRDCAKSGKGGAQVDFQFGRFDAALEEILHMLWQSGYRVAYPDAFGMKDSKLSRAMDKQIADCGNAFDDTLKYPHCSGSYHYADDTCDYGCLVAEYQYWTLTSILGAQDGTSRWATASDSGQCERIEDEWELCSKSDVQSKDPAVSELYDLDGKNKYKIPDRLPKGKYSPKPRPKQCSMALHAEYQSFKHALVVLHN